MVDLGSDWNWKTACMLHPLLHGTMKRVHTCRIVEHARRVDGCRMFPRSLGWRRMLGTDIPEIHNNLLTVHIEDHWMHLRASRRHIWCRLVPDTLECLDCRRLADSSIADQRNVVSLHCDPTDSLAERIDPFLRLKTNGFLWIGTRAMDLTPETMKSLNHTFGSLLPLPAAKPTSLPEPVVAGGRAKRNGCESFNDAGSESSTS